MTGASSGIGAETARALAAAGAAVALVARREDRLRQLAREINDAGGTAHVAPGDLSDRAAVADVIERAVAALGRLDVLANVAGLVDVAPTADADPEGRRRMVAVNLEGPMIATRAAIPHLRAAGGGDVVNVSSTSGLYTGPGLAAYSATKFGVEGFSEGLRQEVSKADGIRVAIVRPGPVATELPDHIADEGARAGIKDWFASIEPLEPGDVADAIAYAVTRPRRVSLGQILIRPTASETYL